MKGRGWLAGSATALTAISPARRRNRRAASSNSTSTALDVFRCNVDPSASMTSRRSPAALR